jgi:nucleoid-associated protein YgaU
VNRFLKKIIGGKERAAASTENTAPAAQPAASATAAETMRQFGVENESPSAPAAATTETSAPAAEVAPVAEETPAATEAAAVEEQPAAVEEAPPAAAAPEIYVVQSGDSLSAIAQQLYGDAGQYTRIFEANRDKISDPNLIFPGQELVIPR